MLELIGRITTELIFRKAKFASLVSACSLNQSVLRFLWCFVHFVLCCGTDLSSQWRRTVSLFDMLSNLHSQQIFLRKKAYISVFFSTRIVASNANNALLYTGKTLNIDTSARIPSRFRLWPEFCSHPHFFRIYIEMKPIIMHRDNHLPSKKTMITFCRFSEV